MIGETVVITGVKMIPGTPYPDSPDEGTISVGAELMPMASPEFEVGPPREAAIELYRRALALDYGQLQWRLALATLLAQTGQVADAIQEAKTCLRLHPGFEAARKLIEDLSILPAAIAGEGPVR